MLGGQQRRQGNLDGFHFFIVKILCLQGRLPFGDAVDIGGDDVTQLPQPFPVVGLGQLFFLDRQLACNALAQVLHCLAQRHGFLPHGIAPVSYNIILIQ